MGAYVVVTAKRDGTIERRVWCDTLTRAKYALKASKEHYREFGYIIEPLGRDGFTVRSLINRDYLYTVYIADGTEHEHHYAAQ
jgi:hypothetical protein